MFVKQLFTNGKIKALTIITIACLYVLSILVCTIGFFTPYWLRGFTRYRTFRYVYNYIFRTYSYIYYEEAFQSAGLISGGYRFPYSRSTEVILPDVGINQFGISFGVEVDQRNEVAGNMERTFYYMLVTMCVLYTNLAMTLVAYVFNLFDNKIYMGFLSLHYAVIYPLGAISVLIGSIMLEVEYRSKVGYSTILGTVSGGLMLLFYVTLRFYNDQYIQWRLKCPEQVDNNGGQSKLFSKKEDVRFNTNQQFKLD